MAKERAEASHQGRCPAREPDPRQGCYHIPEMEELQGVLERIVYEGKDGYTVARLIPANQENEGRLYTVVGSLAAVSPGENLLLRGWWSVHPKYGRQFEVKEYETILPATEAGIQKYLGSGLIKGIGPVLSTRIIECFGKDALRIIEEEPERLMEVDGIGPHRLELIARAWEEQKEIRQVMLFLKAHDVSTSYAVKIFKTYGREAIKVVQQNPYQLAEDIFGIGFKTADGIAMKLGIARDAPARIEAAVQYTLSEAADEGHVYLPKAELVSKCKGMLEVDEDRVERAVDELARREAVLIEQEPTQAASAGRGEAVFLAPFYYAEIGVVNRLKGIIAARRSVDSQKIENLLRQLERRKVIDYSPEQREAIKAALTSKVLILTGGPGTGKTTTVQGIIQVMEQLGWRVLLAAPTGRAAKRLSEATGREAKTIHRLLGYRPPKEFQYNERNWLKADAVIIDELSMVDLILMNNLVKAVPPRASLLLVGDVDQLPSVGAGNVLHDLIQSGKIPVVKLTEIFRQAQQSRIVVNAHRVNRGEFPYLKATDKDDFFFIEEERPEQAAEIITELVSDRLPRFYGFDRVRDIQVLSPMYRGAAGADNLNSLLQERLNPKEPLNLPFTSRRFRIGDKVMQIHNDYEKDVFNGDIGQIVAVDREEQKMMVEFPDRGVVPYEAADLNELVLAYAITIHKSQGNEYRAVVMPILTHHYVMLQRNLLYTAITRAKELVVIVGTKKALGIAVRNDRQQLRYSHLSARLASSG